MSLLCTDIIFVEVDLGKPTALYWFNKLPKRPYKSRFIANSSSRSTFFLRLVPTELKTGYKKFMRGEVQI